MKSLQNICYLIFAVGMLIYAIPQLKIGHGYRIETLFAAVWLGLALVVIAAQLYVILKVDQEVEQKVSNKKPVNSPNS